MGRAPDMGPPGVLNLPAGTTLDGVPLASPAGMSLIETVVRTDTAIGAFVIGDYPAARMLRAYGVGGGGAGGGTLPAGAGQASSGSGGGGGAGFFLELDAAGIAAMPASAAIRAGRGGVAGGVSALSTYIEYLSGVLLEAGGGVSGNAGSAATPPNVGGGAGAGGTVSVGAAPSGFLLAYPGGAGRRGGNVSTTLMHPGDGGDGGGPLGGLGARRGFQSSAGVGVAGHLYGGGAAGANTNGGATAAANGAQGVLVIEVWG